MNKRAIQESAELTIYAAIAAFDGAEETERDGEKYLSMYIGTVMDVTPSGKYYQPWTTNQSDEDVECDDIWWEKVVSICDAEGYWVDSGEGDPCDLYLCRV